MTQVPQISSTSTSSNSGLMTELQELYTKIASVVSEVIETVTTALQVAWRWIVVQWQSRPATPTETPAETQNVSNALQTVLDQIANPSRLLENGEIITYCEALAERSDGAFAVTPLGDVNREALNRDLKKLLNDPKVKTIAIPATSLGRGSHFVTFLYDVETKELAFFESFGRSTQRGRHCQRKMAMPGMTIQTFRENLETVLGNELLAENAAKIQVDCSSCGVHTLGYILDRVHYGLTHKGAIAKALNRNAQAYRRELVKAVSEKGLETVS